MTRPIDAGSTEPEPSGSDDGPRRSGPLPGWLAVTLVVGTSGSVLVLEILAGRLMAPYVGVSLETYTGIIGTVLAGIALGAWAGGELADRVEPRRLIPALLMLGGALAIASIPLVRALGASADGDAGRGPFIILLAAVGFLPSATVLSAVPPAVVKLQLRDLRTTGTTVGRFSAWGTGGAIVATFLTGFVLVAWAAVTTLIVAVGVLLVVAGAVLWFVTSPGHGSEVLGAGGLAALSLVGVATIDAPCDTQTSYYCLTIEVDPANPSGRTLVLDDLRHSYVDLDDPTNLQFWYIRRLVDAIEELGPDGPIDITYLGGGGFTIPGYIAATRPGSEQTVHEIDGDLVEIVEDELVLDRDDVDVVVGDARLTLADRPADSADVVIGDAFGSRAVPWHLATDEFIEEVARVLRPEGIYAANIIDEPGQRFLRAEAATIARTFPHVAVLLGSSAAAGRAGNSVIVAGRTPFDPSRLDALMAADGAAGRLVTDLDDFLDGATILTDDFAPVDQLIARGD